jgi:hypothetical protein
MRQRAPESIYACLLPLVLIAVLVFTMSPAQADPAAASKCRGSLGPEARRIYDSAAPQVTPRADLRDVLKQRTRSLVLAGKVQRATAPDSAEEAAHCLRVLQK